LIELDPRDLDVLLRERMALLDAGLEVEAFGGNTLQVRSLPACIAMEDPESFLGEMIEEMLHGTVSGGKFAFTRLARIMANKATRRAVPRANEALALLEELFACDLPYCAADGRPTLTEYNRKDIDRRFGVGRG
jgi:DNA mismatch repair protein MutL